MLNRILGFCKAKIGQIKKRTLKPYVVEKVFAEGGTIALSFAQSVPTISVPANYLSNKLAQQKLQDEVITINEKIAKLNIRVNIALQNSTRVRKAFEAYHKSLIQDDEEKIVMFRNILLRSMLNPHSSDTVDEVVSYLAIVKNLQRIDMEFLSFFADPHGWVKDKQIRSVTGYDASESARSTLKRCFHNIDESLMDRTTRKLYNEGLINTEKFGSILGVTRGLDLFKNNQLTGFGRRFIEYCKDVNS